VLPVLSKATVVGDVIGIWQPVELSNPLKIALLVATQIHPVPFIVPLTEITELQLLLTIMQSSVALL
jgi:hypothetical protein